MECPAAAVKCRGRGVLTACSLLKRATCAGAFFTGVAPRFVYQEVAAYVVCA
jgi:nitrogenase subunit NifH